MTLDEFIQERIKSYVSDLAKLSSVTTIEAEDKKRLLLNHLRNFYRLKNSYFSYELIEKIKELSDINNVSRKSTKRSVSVDDNPSNFEVGKEYLSENGAFEVLAMNPYPVIDPPVYPKCQTPYFASHMLKEHNRLVEKGLQEARTAEEFARDFRTPDSSAEAEVVALTAAYHSIVENNHQKFLLDHGKPDFGTQSTGRRPRETHCYSCKNYLDNDLYKECRACGWIICFCGACGCGYTPEGQKIAAGDV